MSAGGPGDHPLSDILDYNLKVFGPDCDRLVVEISKYASRDEMLDTFDWLNKEYLRNPALFESVLKEALQTLMDDRKECGWELL